MPKKIRKGDPLVSSGFVEKIGKNEGGTLWRHLKNLRKKVSLSRKQLVEAFEKKCFLKSIRLKSHSAEKPKKRSFRPIKRFLQTENFKKMQGVSFDDIRKFSKKVAECRKNPKGGPFGLTCCTFGSIKILCFSARIEPPLSGFRNLVEDEQQNR